jgi:hypothetical protein
MYQKGAWKVESSAHRNHGNAFVFVDDTSK